MNFKQAITVAGRAHIQFVQGTRKAFCVAFEVNKFAIQDAGHLIDAIGKQKPPIKHRNFGLILGQIFAIHIYDARHLNSSP